MTSRLNPFQRHFVMYCNSFCSTIVSACCLVVSVLTSLHAEEYDVKRFEKTTICGELVQPMELDLAPDGRLFLIEWGGNSK